MLVTGSINRMRREIALQRKKGSSIGFVPTMGALHEGHLSLIRRARQECGFVAVSIFVNPIQFGPREDLKKYPRPLMRDYLLCKKEGVGLVFHPSAAVMYPAGYRTSVLVSELSDVLCGKFRPGHFSGVATVVSKLFNIVQPDTAYFGQKDAQQAVIIERMVRDLNIPVKIKICPIVRGRRGLALSSRNVYLDDAGRKDALILQSSLKLARQLIKDGMRSSRSIIRRMEQLIRGVKNARIQYIEIVDARDLRPVKYVKNGALIALAVYIGAVRLIDNIKIGRK